MERLHLSLAGVAFFSWLYGAPFLGIRGGYSKNATFLHGRDRHASREDSGSLGAQVLNGRRPRGGFSFFFPVCHSRSPSSASGGMASSQATSGLVQ
jgi:hypothetical protein